MAEILELDQIIFQIINQDWQMDWLDGLMPYWRNKYTWIPLYLFLLVFTIWKFKQYAIYFLLGLILTAGLADSISSHLVKKNIQRIRPCNDPAVKGDVHLLVHCGGGYSFTSSHATNHFALAIYLIFTLGQLYKWIRMPLLFWAASIAYGQVYVGVHYPLDVIVGGLLGSTIGYLVAKFYLSLEKLKIPQLSQS